MPDVNKHAVSKPSVFLATTALEGFWDTSKFIVFLSEACTRYSRKNVWDSLPHAVLKNPFSDRNSYYKNYEYIQSFYERILPQLGNILNQMHGKSYSMRYWRIILGVWLNIYIHTIYERYYSIKNALEQYPNLTTIVLDPRDFITPRDTSDFILLSIEDPYNLQIYSKILEVFKKELPSRRYRYSLPSNSRGDQKGLKKWASVCSGKLTKLFPVVVREPFIRRKSIPSFLLASKGALWIDSGSNQFLPLVNNDDQKRRLLREMEIEDVEFERIFASLFVEDMPQVFIESYEDFHEQSLKRYASVPKAIWSATSWYWDEQFKFWAATRAEEGSQIVPMQHGGNYGMDYIHPLEEHEIAISDRYYSWGWESLDKKIKPMPVSKYVGLRKMRADNRKSGILFAAVNTPRYFYRYYTFRNYDVPSYFNWQQRFISHLPRDLKTKTRMRLFIEDYGWDCHARWKDFDPEVFIEDWKKNFLASLDDCRLHISDHLSSTFADALAANKPTILFWDCEIFKLRPEAVPYLDDLRRAGIFYDSPESAAAAVKDVYDDVETWWNDPMRQETLRRFCDRFVRTSATSLKEWGEEIRFLANK